MTHREQLEQKKFFYKIGVMCGGIIYSTYKFEDFGMMIQFAKDIRDKYKSDMSNCRFIIQTYKDNSYDFETACFSQIEVAVTQIGLRVEGIAQEILKDSKGKKR